MISLGQQVLFAKVIEPRGFFARARGLIGRAPLAADEAWLFNQCNSIHMFGMHFPIDVLFLNKANELVKISHRLPPFAMAFSSKAAKVLEVQAGIAKTLNLKVGQQLDISL